LSAVAHTFVEKPVGREGDAFSEVRPAFPIYNWLEEVRGDQSDQEKSVGRAQSWERVLRA